MTTTTKEPAETIAEVPANDRRVLRGLAKRVAEIAAEPVMAKRIELWRRHNSLHRVRPMILLFPEGGWRELLPDSALACESKAGRRMEGELRRQIYTHEHFADDSVIVGEWVVHRAIRNSGWCLEPKWTLSDDPTGARTFDPVIHEPADLKKLRSPEVWEDEEETKRQLAEAQDLFGDILDVRLKGAAHVSYHLMAQYTSLRGLAEVMMDMIENPGMLHEAMSILEEGHRGVLRQYVERNLLSLNNDNTYHSSGGNGWTDELPAEGFDPDHVRPCDMWASAEAQELAQVSPAMHEEFSMQYEKRLLEPFALTGYGCCEDLTRKLDDVLRIPHIRRISCSPWVNVERCAETLGDRCIFSWKPNPAHLCGEWRPDAVREYIRHALDATRGCVIEMILKDTHTCDGHPERFDEWARIARELVEEH
jgi:hypothetical protein